MQIHVIGGGLAGCEAAYAIAKSGVPVVLHEMKPGRYSPAHKNENLCELVCSNSLKASRLDSAGGLLKAEMEKLGSVTVMAAKETSVPAGGALAVDRDLFAKAVTDILTKTPGVSIVREEVTRIPDSDITIVATGPLTDGFMAEEIRRLCGDTLSFFDAAAPIVEKDSIDMEHAFFGARYGRGGDDYINCPMTKEEYTAFWEALTTAERAPQHAADSLTVFEGCMPVEIMAGRGMETLLYGPLRPVGLRDPKTDKRPHAVVQLRQDNKAGTLYNLVGFQTNLRFPEQKRVFSLIPALRNAEFVRYGVMHRNSFINSPALLSSTLSLKSKPNVYFAGQITGVEGYMESAASGILAGLNAARSVQGLSPLILPPETMLGALIRYITEEGMENFQPMNANFGILPPLDTRIRDKHERYLALAERSLASFQ